MMDLVHIAVVTELPPGMVIDNHADSALRRHPAGGILAAKLHRHTLFHCA